MAVAPQLQTKTVSGVRNVAVSFSNMLDSGELLTGTPTIAEVTTTDLTLGSKAVSTAILTINGESTPIGEAVQFNVSGGTANVTYQIKITVGTDASPAQTLLGIVKLTVLADS